jgi:response regulator RpfG family c-di-GMP phosphodiesterase
MSNKPVILCVDDERNVIEGLKLNLSKQYSVLTGVSGREGLDILAQRDDVAVVVSDMRMPEMDGAQFLAEVRRCAPDTVRMLLTGYSDIDAAIRAVNDGQVFRFLMKPCSPEHLIASITAGVQQYRLITAEREVLQKTLVGSVKALVEVLALTNPMALGRAVRLRDRVRKVANALALEQPWRVEVAALLSQLGAVSLPEDTVRKLYDGEQLDRGEQNKLVDNMQTINKILGNIPRLESVTAILVDVANRLSNPSAQHRSLESRMLQAVIDLDTLEAQGQSLRRSMADLVQKKDVYGDETLTALASLLNRSDELDVVAVPVEGLADGMVLCDDLKTKDGVLILPRGFAITGSSREHLANFKTLLPDTTVRVLTPQVVKAQTDATPGRKHA